MLKRTICTIMFLMLPLAMLTLLFNVQPVESEPTTIIVPNDYPTFQKAINAANDGDTIKVGWDIWSPDPLESVVVNKSVTLINPGYYAPILDFVVVADSASIIGFMTGGLSILADNVSINRVGVGPSGGWGFPYSGISLNGANGCNLSEVGVGGINEGSGITLSESSNNIIANSFFDSVFVNVGLIAFISSFNNTFSGNTVWSNWAPSVYLDDSSGNKFFGNSFNVYYAEQVTVLGDSANIWDQGYPSGGNHWNDYNGTDFYTGPYQNETGSDGIGDTPYVFNGNNQDYYPLVTHNITITEVAPSKTVVGEGLSLNVSVTVENQGDYAETFNVTTYANTTVINTIASITLASNDSTTLTFPWNTTGYVKGNYIISAYATAVPGETSLADNNFTDGRVTIAMVGDITGPEGYPDDKVDIRDIGSVARLFGAESPDPKYDPNCDIVYDKKIDIKDIALAAIHYGETEQ